MSVLAELKTAEVVQMVAAALAAIAACASWASVWQSRRAFKTGLSPHLDGYWNNDFDGGVLVAIHNTGGGIARNPYLYVVTDGRGFKDRIVQTGPLRPGQEQRIVLVGASRPRSTDEIAGVICCQDWEHRWHVWAWDGRHALLRDRVRRSPERLDPDRALRVMYPGGVAQTSSGELSRL